MSAIPVVPGNVSSKETLRPNIHSLGHQAHFTTFIRFLLFLSLLFFFASPKKNQKKRPENEDSRFRVVLWGAVVQGGE
jgi:hypothetical protein